VACGRQLAQNGTADKTCSSCQKNSHEKPPSEVFRRQGQNTEWMQGLCPSAVS
jgi:hypothetical protein